MLSDVQVCVVGKAFKPNRLKVLALNRALNEYFRLVRWYIGFNSYAKQFPKPVMEDLNGIRGKFKRSKKINRRFHSLPSRRLQTIIEYKALLEGIEVKYLTKKETRGTSKTCHRCGHIAHVKARIFKCPKCGIEYDRDLNACINIAHRVISSMGWGSREPPEPAYGAGGVKPQLNAGSLAPRGRGSSRFNSCFVEGLGQ